MRTAIAILFLALFSSPNSRADDFCTIKLVEVASGVFSFQNVTMIEQFECSLPLPLSYEAGFQFEDNNTSRAINTLTSEMNAAGFELVNITPAWPLQSYFLQFQK